MAFRILIYCVEILIALHSVPIYGVGAIDLGLGFLVEPDHITLLEGKRLTLNCSAFGGTEYGPLNITWQHEGKNINDARRYVLPNGSLYFDKVVNQHKGWYVCIASNDVGSVMSRFAQLKVASIHENFSNIPQPFNVSVGEVARFSCSISASPEVVISWEKNKQNVQPDDRIIIQPTGVLQIYNVKKSDAGKYKCVARNLAGTKRSPAAQLTVRRGPSSSQVPTILSPHFQEIRKKKGETAILECLTSLSAKPSLTWTRKDGGALPNLRISQIGQGSLVISSLTANDSGIYVCTVSIKDPGTNEISTISQSTTLKVLVPPSIVVRPNSIAKLISITARFKCIVEGIPTPTVRWMKNGRPLRINFRMKTKDNSVLIVAQTVASDSGIYQCVVSNAAGIATAAARLHVNTSSDQPLAPTKLVATMVSSSSIHVKWNPSVSPVELPIKAYSIHYFPTEGGKEIQKVTVNTSRLFTKLEPYTNYTFYVRAYNGRSASSQSKRVYEMTGEDVPVGAPLIAVKSTNPTSMYVSWQNLPPKIARGHIIAYKIYYRRRGEASHTVIDVTGDVQHATISELNKGGVYDVRVLAGTKVGFPVLSDQKWPWLTHPLPKFMSNLVPSTPELVLDAINGTVIVISWSVDYMKKIEGFKLSYRKQSHLLQGPIELATTSKQYVLKNLDQHSWYEIHFSAFNKHGDGPEAVRNIFTSSDENSTHVIEPVLAPPHNLDAFPLSKSSIKLKWQVPDSLDEISFYTIYYNIVHLSGNAAKPKMLRSTTKDVVVTDLLPFTLYEFTVQSHDENAVNSPLSQKVECMTKEDVPSPPLDVSWNKINESAVQVYWLPPDKPNGVILRYHIMYNSETPNLEKLDLWNSAVKNGKERSVILSRLEHRNQYYVVIFAETSAGRGSPSSSLRIMIPVIQGSRNATTMIDPEETPDSSNKRPPATNLSLGIIVGISIGAFCIIVCVIIIICRSRCFPPTTQPLNGNLTHIMCKENGHVPVMNGNGFVRNSRCPESHEMESLPMLMTAIANGSISEGPLDTKGGYPVKKNGPSHPNVYKHIANGHIINGNSHHMQQVNITENPQCEDNTRCNKSDPSEEVFHDASQNLSQESACKENMSQSDAKLDNSSTPLLSVTQSSQEPDVDV